MIFLAKAVVHHKKNGSGIRSRMGLVFLKEKALDAPPFYFEADKFGLKAKH